MKRIEADSGAKISIRGKGSVKEGKARADGSLAPGEEEDLHCLVTADSEDKVKIALKAIEKVIETVSSWYTFLTLQRRKLITAPIGRKCPRRAERIEENAVALLGGTQRYSER